jgi:hypothetical protein
MVQPVCPVFGESLDDLDHVARFNRFVGLHGVKTIGQHQGKLRHGAPTANKQPVPQLQMLHLGKPVD